MKITKVGAGYVYREGANYRCRECVHFMADKERCFLLGPSVKVLRNWACIMWAEGAAPFISLKDWKAAYTPSEVGLTSDKNGTQCRRCEHFDAPGRDCEIVNKNSRGDTPGEINPGACCGNQTPR